jgi:hypothetical protein
MTEELRGGYGQFCEIGDKVGIIWNIWGKVAINWVKETSDKKTLPEASELPGG